MNIAFITLAVLLASFVASLLIVLKVKSEDRRNLKNGAEGLAFGTGVLTLIWSWLFFEFGRGYQGRCYKFWNDVGTPCSRLEYIRNNTDWGFLALLEIGWPFIAAFLGVCVVGKLVWSRVSRKDMKTLTEN